MINTVTWWQNGGVKFTIGTQIDGLAVMMLFVVTLISLLVHIYSTATCTATSASPTSTPR